MSLPAPPKQYDQADQQRTRGAIASMDQQNYKKQQDLELTADQRLIMRDTVTGDRGVISVASGVITWTAL